MSCKYHLIRKILISLHHVVNTHFSEGAGEVNSKLSKSEYNNSPFALHRSIRTKEATERG